MTGLEEAREALKRAQADHGKAERQGVAVHGLMGSLSSQLEENGFSVRIARLYNLEDPRR